MVLPDLFWLVQAYGAIGLFVVVFLAASILPLPSEPAIVAATSAMPLETVFIVAVIGGILGALTNYFIGSKGLRGLWFHQIKRDTKDEKRARQLFEKYGYYAVFVAPWIPFIGDPILIVAGALKPDLKKFLIAVTAGRFIKTLALIYIGKSILGLGP